MKTALVTGTTGQTASYLAEILLEKGYKVIGTRRRTSAPNNENVVNCLSNPNFELVTADITDYSSVSGLVEKYKPDEIYNLAAQSFVKASFDQPFHTFDTDTIGVLNFLEVIRKQKPDTKFYQASTSEMFGKSVSMDYDVQGCLVRYDGPMLDKNHGIYLNRCGFQCMTPQSSSDGLYQDENTIMEPQSPYGIAKLAAHHLCRLYRQSYNIFACCGILFNHESPRRGKEFVTRKITDYVGWLNNHLKLSKTISNMGLAPKLKLGNLDSYRDWGFAHDYARAQYMILQHDKADDFVICTGESHTVREFCQYAFERIGLDYKDWVEVDPQFYRPSEVDYLCGDCSKAKEILGWEPEITFQELVNNMVDADIKRYES